MVEPPNYGSQPPGPDPRYPQGPGPAQPPPGQGPPQYPPGGSQPPYGPPSGPPGGPPQFPPPPGGYPSQFGPGPKKNRTWLYVTIAVVAAVLVAALILLALFWPGEDEAEPGAGEETTTEEETTPEEETTGPPTVEEAVGLCLPYEPVVSGFSFDLTTPCDSAEAFWTITAASDAIDATADAEGRLTDPQPAYDLCGEEYGAYQLGELWKDWYFTYDDTSLAIEEMYCVEAIGNPDADGRTPVTPDTGACFDDSDQWWTVPCDSDLALYEVLDAIAVDPPEEMSDDQANSASADCSGGDFFWQVTDIEGRTTAILCGDEV